TDAAVHGGGATERRRRDRALSAVRFPRNEQGGAQRLPDAQARRHAEGRRRHDADARRALRLPRIPRVRAEARRALCERQDVTTADIPLTEASTPPKPKKSVALSGVTAGNTALCTVGRTGNDLAYRGYDILDIADA